MNAQSHQQLRHLYAEWHRLTEQETAAIEGDDWPDLLRHQNLKRGLQEQIIQAADHGRPDRGEAAEWTAALAHEFRPVIARLIEMETHNHELLCARRQAAQGKIASLDRASANLRAIRRAYTADTSPRWRSYS